jgi:hypothetical protein
MRERLRERRDLRPAEREPITGQPLICPACGTALSEVPVYAGHCANERCRYYEELVWAEYDVWHEYQQRSVTTVRGGEQRSILLEASR